MRCIHCREFLLFLAINRKTLCQTLSSMHNLVIVLLFGCLVLLCLTEKSADYMQHERSLRLCHNDCTSSYDELLGKQGLVNIHVKNIQQLMTEIFKYLKRQIFPYYE